METSKTSIRTLWVHPGGPKTGSSAIQNYLESNASALATKDVAYENKIGISQANEINSGNGARLFNAFANDDSSPTQIDEVVSSYLGNLNTGICSCEYLSDLTLSQWKRLASSCVRNGIRLNFIFCVRNVIPYFQSSYDQAIKRHGEWRELKDWIVELPWVHSITLKHLAQVVPSDRLRVIHYETCKSNLITEVLQAIDIDCSSPEFGAQSAVPTNRSLTVNERSVLRKINRVFGDIHSASISDHLLYNYPSAKTQLEPIPRQTKFDLIRRFSGEVERVNETFFLGKKIVSISETSEKNGEPSKLSTMSRPIAKINSRRNIDREIMEWALARVAGAQHAATQLIIVRLRDIDWEYSSDPSIPCDFDPVAYLLHNVDILMSGVKPYKHYIVSGHLESGRRWRWEQCKTEAQEKFGNDLQNDQQN